MTKHVKSLAAAALMAAAALPLPAAAQVAGIATSSTEAVFFRAAARTAAYQQIQTQYAAQIQQIGTVRLTLDDEIVAERPLVALEAVPEGGFFKRMSDDFWQWWETD